MRRSRALSKPLVAASVCRSWADCIINIAGFDLRQAQEPTEFAALYRIEFWKMDLGAFTGRGQGGPCLTDAAQKAPPDVAVANVPLRRNPNDAAASTPASVTRGHSTSVRFFVCVPHPSYRTENLRIL